VSVVDSRDLKLAFERGELPLTHPAPPRGRNLVEEGGERRIAVELVHVARDI